MERGKIMNGNEKIMENMEKIRTQLGCIKGLANIGDNVFYFREQGEKTDEQFKNDLMACGRLLQMYVEELNEMLGNEVKGNE